MANFRLPNGAVLAIESGRAAAKAISAFSNADPGVMTLEASHGISQGDAFVVYNGWSKTNGRAFVAGAVVTNDVEVQRLNTSNTTAYTPGSGVGTVRKITGWQQILGVVNPQSSGGEQQYQTVQALEDDVQQQLPTVRSPYGLQFQVADDDEAAWFDIAQEASESGEDIALKLTLKNGSFILYHGILTLDETPSLGTNEPMLMRVTLSLKGKPTRYPASVVSA